MNLSCNKCGAPLEVPKGTNFLTCTYCGARLAVHAGVGAAYTEVLEQIDRKADRILEGVEEINRQNARILKQVSVVYEECHIEWDVHEALFRSDVFFYAESIGRDGSLWSMAESPTIKMNMENIGGADIMPKPTKAALRAHAELMEDLVASGWECTGEGPLWFERSFRRKVK